MPVLTIHQGGRTLCQSFEGNPVLASVLAHAGIAHAHPCGGRGACGKCAVALSGAVSAPSAAEEKAGVRLSCQARLLGDAVVTLPQVQPIAQIELSAGAFCGVLSPMAGRLGAAIDIGTTTLALQLYDLSSGAPLASAAMLNPQTQIAADVIGRIDAALHGQGGFLQTQIEQALSALLFRACQDAGKDAQAVDSLVIAGNTTMLYLLSGRDPSSLARAPFEADCLFGDEEAILGRRALLPPCMNAFVGADISCAVLASGMTAREETALLCDIGTNGEIALWHKGRLLVASTAAGPAFEGAGISCGVTSVPGAIDRVWIEDGALRAHTISDAPAVGLCGSGLIDATCALLTLGLIDETGATNEDALPLADGVCLLPQDVRAVQLCKGAIAAGIGTLLETAGVSEQEITRLYIAGGFGAHLNIKSAAGIGLIPRALVNRVAVIGNASLCGAAQLLLSGESRAAISRIAKKAEHVTLSGNPTFNMLYMEHMLFPEQE